LNDEKEGSSEKSQLHFTAIFESRFGFLNAFRKVFNGVRKLNATAKRKKKKTDLGPHFLNDVRNA
jgi:hypothetical protein